LPHDHTTVSSALNNELLQAHKLCISLYFTSFLLIYWLGHRRTCKYNTLFSITGLHPPYLRSTTSTISAPTSVDPQSLWLYLYSSSKLYVYFEQHVSLHALELVFSLIFEKYFTEYLWDTRELFLEITAYIVR